MTSRRIELLMLGAALLLAAIAVVRWRGATPALASVAASQLQAPDSLVPFDDDSLDMAFERAVNRNPFRLTRAPSDVPYSPTTVEGAPPAPKFAPQLTLRGIVGGPPWQAVIDGIPGSPPGTVVVTGSTFDKLTIKRVTRDSVAVQTPDSSWHLTLRKGTP